MDETRVNAPIQNDADYQRRINAATARVNRFLETIQTNTFEAIPTGLKDIDKAIGGGMMRGQLVILGAAPGMGKTALATWIFANLAKMRKPSIYLNLEMSPEQLIARRFAAATAAAGKGLTPVEVLQGYKRNPDEWSAIKAAAMDVITVDAYMETPETPVHNITEILSYADKQVEIQKKLNQEAPFLVVDYLQKIAGDPEIDRGLEKTAVIQRAISKLKEFALKNQTIVFLIVAHNRDSNKNGQLSMESARDTSDIEYTADLQLGITYTACLYPKKKAFADKSGNTKEYTAYRTPAELQPAEKKFLTVQATKTRFGESGATSHLYFDGAAMTFMQVGYDFIPIDEATGKTFEEWTGIKIDTATGKTTGVERKNSPARKPKAKIEFDA